MTPTSGAPLFTLITSTLNSAATLERCLKSVAAQLGSGVDTSAQEPLAAPHQAPLFEHLIADGASSDATLEIVERYRDIYGDRCPLRLACSAPDSGLYQAWNRGIEQARGQWILFLGSDDFLIAPDGLSRVAAAIVADPSLAGHSFLYADTEAPHPQPDWATYRENRWLQRLRGATNYPTSVFIAARLFQQGARFDESYRICADHKFFAEHGFFATAAYLPIPLIAFQAGGISSNRDFGRLHYRERRRMLQELGRPRPFFSEWYYWLRASR